MSQVVILDNEAVQALGDPRHPQHRRVVSHAQVVTSRQRRAVAVEIVVPTAVRVEAGWDRTAPAWAFPNHLRILDVALDTGHANTAATIARASGASVADAHLGATIRLTGADRITVLTSDPDDMQAAAGNRSVTIVTL